MHDPLVGNFVVSFLCAASLTSCSLLIETHDRQCKTDADCVNAKLGTLCADQVCVESSSCEGPACTTADAVINSKCANDDECTNDAAPRCFNKTCVSSEIAQRWMCKDDDKSVSAPTIRYNVHIVEFLSRQPPKNIVVKACRQNDPNCEAPATVFTDTGGTGDVQLELQTGFTGFFEITSDAMPTLLYVTKKIVKNTANRDLPVLNATTVAALAEITKVPFDENKGIALIEALDCSTTPQGGIQFKLIDAMADAFYLVDGVPSKDAMLTEYDSVNNSANGGFINVPPGSTLFSAHQGIDGLELGTFNVVIRKGTITFIEMYF